MSEQLKYIVQELNKPPFNKSYNLISFDGLDQIQLLQALNDVCSEIESKVSQLNWVIDSLVNSFWCFDVYSKPGHKILSKFPVQGQVAIFIFKTRTKYFAA